MPPKAKVTKEMILAAAFELVRESGAEAVNARTVAEKLGCSTQPIMYHFKTMEELKKALYAEADAFHSEFLMDIRSDNPMMDMGLNYIRFGAREGKLFRFLFQSGEFSGKNIPQLIDDPQLQPILAIVSQEAGVSMEQAKTLFRTLFLCVHGYASMYANNDLNYDEETISADLNLIFEGALAALKGDNHG